MYWTNDLRSIRDCYHAIGLRWRTRAHSAWSAREFPHDIWRDLARQGILRSLADDTNGFRSLAASLEGYTAGSLDGGFTISLICHGVMGMETLRRYGDAPVRERWLPRLAGGDDLLAFAVTEPHGGTDAFRPETTLRGGSAGTLRLDGAKWHITNAPMATVILCCAHQESTGGLALVLVERGTPGVSISEPLAPAGARSSPVASIAFNDVAVPRSSVIASGDGLRALRGALVAERILAGFSALGLLDGIIGQTLSFVQKRRVSGRAIGSYQHIQRRLTDMKIAAETTRALAHATMEQYLRGCDVGLEASLLKMHGVDAAMRSSIDAIQACGSYGLQEETGLSMVLLDALAATIGGGTEEAHRSVIYREMLRRQG